MSNRKNTNVNPKVISRLFGISFAISFLSYGLGSSLMESVIHQPLVEMGLEQSTLVCTAVVLMALIHSLSNIALPVLLWPIISAHGMLRSAGYSALAVMATVTLAITSLPMLSLVNLAGASDAQMDLQALANVAIDFYGNGYQLGMAMWGLGGMLLCSVLLTARLLPAWLSVWGIIGYAVFATGTVLELYGLLYGLYFSVIGGLFELFLIVWMMTKGLSDEPYVPAVQAS